MNTATQTVIEDRTISGTDIGIAIRDVDSVVLRGLRIQTPTGIEITGDCESIDIEDVVIEGYSRFGVLIRGGRNYSPTRVRIRKMVIIDPKPGAPTLPFAMYQGKTRKPISDVVIEDLTIIGPGIPNIRSIKDSGSPDNATSDQIVIHGVQGATLRRVRSLLGGENGISITRGSTNVTMIDCVANYADGQGFHLGTHGFEAKIHVIGGECIGNGRNKEGKTNGNFAGALCQSSNVFFENWKTSGTERGIIAGKTANVKVIDCEIDCPIMTEGHAGAKIEICN